MSCTSQLLSSICERVICCRYTSMFVSFVIFCCYTSMLVSCVISCRYRYMFVSCVMCCRYTYTLVSCVICCRYSSMLVSCVICCRCTSMLVSFRPSVSSWLSSCVRELYVAVCARANIYVCLRQEVTDYLMETSKRVVFWIQELVKQKYKR